MFLLYDTLVVHNSTLIGVLTSGELDDGNGKARNLVANHKHEIDSGKTSSISTKTLKLSNNKAITFIDLCGHEKYFKTTSFGLSAHFPDYAFIIVSANRGVLPMTRQHFRLILSFNIPAIFIITHIDISPPDIYKNTIQSIAKMCNNFGGKMTSVKLLNTLEEFLNKTIITDNNVLTETLEILQYNNIKQLVFPVLSVSNTTGFYINLLKELIAKLPLRDFWNSNSSLNNKFVKFFKLHIDNTLIKPFTPFTGSLFYIDDSYNPPGIGLVISGINRGAAIKPGDTMFLGPFGKEFIEIRIKTLHNNIKQLVEVINNHDRGCISFAPKRANDLTKDKIKKGMLLFNNIEYTKHLCYHFKAAITIFNNSITLKNGYCPVMHMNTIRQTTRLILDTPPDNSNQISTLDKDSVAVVKFKFKIKPEFIEPYNIFIFRSGNIHGIGMIIEPIYLENDNDAAPDPIKSKKSKRSVIKSTLMQKVTENNKKIKKI
jgi:elongation factor 1-alpha